MNHTYWKVPSVLIVMLFLLSGCLYPDSQLEKNQVPNDDQLKMVQTAVDDYRNQTNGLVPIKTKNEDTPIFEKYIIDFHALKEKNSLSEIPGNAYENGGVYQYTLITPEDNPRVKLIDLRLTEALRSVRVKLDTYRSKHTYPPFGKEIGPDVYQIDYKKMGLDKKPTVKSPYSEQNLPVVMDHKGELFVDYRADLYKALTEKNDKAYKKGDDIRYLLTEDSPFVPAYSLPYTVENNEPVFLDAKKDK